MKRGAFIVFEGLDRCGKSTQVDLLMKKLSKVKEIGFPDRGTMIGSNIDNYLKNKNEMDDHVIHLLFSSNRWEKQNDIRNDLKNGTTLICSRYAYSGVAYSTAKGLNLDWCKGPDRHLIKPDLVIFLDIDPSLAQKRSNYGDERYEKVQFQSKVKQIFVNLLQNEDNVVIIDASSSIDDIHSKIMEMVTDTLKKVECSPIQSLWTTKE